MHESVNTEKKKNFCFCICFFEYDVLFRCSIKYLDHETIASSLVETCKVYQGMLLDIRVRCGARNN